MYIRAGVYRNGIFTVPACDNVSISELAFIFSAVLLNDGDDRNAYRFCSGSVAYDGCRRLSHSRGEIREYCAVQLVFLGVLD